MVQLTKEQQALLVLLRRSLWGEQAEIANSVDWEEINKIAKEQGVISFAYDGTRGLNLEIPGEILQKWKQRVLAGVARSEPDYCTQQGSHSSMKEKSKAFQTSKS